jgi:cleavage and polyadenylation specificity factor subunit 1
MQVMYLTEFKAEPGSSTINEEDEEDIEDTKVLFVAVGTGIVDHNGEDVSSKGRALLFRLTPSRGQLAELSLCYEKQIFHGPVASLSCLSVDRRNRLVIGAGSDVNIEQWGNDKLTQVGFFRATMEVLDITLFKNFFLLSDAYDSLYFLVWRESDKSLTLLAKDYDPIPVYAAGLMSRGAAMTFLCHDDRQNLQFFQYAPGEAAARGGNKLVCRADCHLGTQTTGFVSHFCRSSLLIHSATPTSTLAALKQQDTFFGRTDDDQRLGVHFGTTDGGIASVVPVSEPVYWRLMALQSVMANALESNCALNQRAWRLYRRTPRRGGCRSNDRKKGLLDGDLLFQYADLPVADQEDLAASIGSTVDLILDNLLDIQCGSVML